MKRVKLGTNSLKIIRLTKAYVKLYLEKNKKTQKTTDSFYIHRYKKTLKVSS